MGILYTGFKGLSLKDIVKNKDYNTIEVRCIYHDLTTNEQEDILFGYCQYLNGKLISLDGDIYSLNDLYIKYEEWEDQEHNLCLTVWDYGEYN